jgi:hypothetical protein
MPNTTAANRSSAPRDGRDSCGAPKSPVSHRGSSWPFLQRQQERAAGSVVPDAGCNSASLVAHSPVKLRMEAEVVRLPGIDPGEGGDGDHGGGDQHEAARGWRRGMAAGPLAGPMTPNGSTPRPVPAGTPRYGARSSAAVPRRAAVTGCVSWWIGTGCCSSSACSPARSSSSWPVAHGRRR